MPCDLNHSEDQRQILDAAAALLDENFSVSRASGGDAKKTGKLAEFGTFALALDEAHGGGGFTLVEEVLLHVLFGRHNLSTLALAAPIAARIAVETGNPELAQEVAAGHKTVCAAMPAGDNLRLVDAEGADLAILFAGHRLELFDVGGLAGETVAGLGHHLGLTDISADAPKRISASNSSSILDIADLLIAAQLLGIAEATRDLAVSHAGTRRQFGKPIGAFQAIKHHCANMAIDAEILSAQVDMAAIAARDGRDDGQFQTAAARLLAPRVALGNARLCIQVHGGIGFSAEADAHRFLKQAHLLRQLGSGRAMLDLASPMSPHQPPH